MFMSRKKLIILAIVAIIIALFFYLGLPGYLNLDSLKANRTALSQMYTEYKFAFVSLFIVLYIIQTALSLPGATIFSLAAGAIFGAVMGTVYAVIAATVGATLAFLATRYIFRDAVRNKLGSRLDKLNRELSREGINYLLFVRLVPLFPFFMINLAAGLTNIRLRTFFLGTLFGIIPGAFVYCNAGASLASINSVGDIASPRTIGSFALLGLFSLLPVLYRKIKNRRNFGPGAKDE
jgi:uncharacterized membrane protein YdjX (TVP38/TMEM64 family)